MPSDILLVLQVAARYGVSQTLLSRILLASVVMGRHFASTCIADNLEFHSTCMTNVYWVENDLCMYKYLRTSSRHHVHF